MLSSIVMIILSPQGWGCFQETYKRRGRERDKAAVQNQIGVYTPGTPGDIILATWE